MKVDCKGGVDLQCSVKSDGNVNFLWSPVCCWCVKIRPVEVKHVYAMTL